MKHSRDVYVAACGLLCSECPAFIATKDNDRALIERTATEWSSRYGVDVRPEHVWCEGCMTENGRKCRYCEAGCTVRACAVEKGFFSCSQCECLENCEKKLPIAQHVPASAMMLAALAGFRKQFSPKE